MSHLKTLPAVSLPLLTGALNLVAGIHSTPTARSAA